MVGEARKEREREREYRVGTAVAAAERGWGSLEEVACEIVDGKS